MWKLFGIEVKGNRPICVKRKVCRYFYLGSGRIYSREKIGGTVFGCVLGQFKITHERWCIPEKCKAKYMARLIKLKGGGNGSVS